MVCQQDSKVEESRKPWPDRRLVRECLRGNEEAWSALVDQYKRLIYSIPVKYGFPADEAADIFQAVCLELLSELCHLRNPKALPKWIIEITAHKCLHRKRQQQRVVVSDPNDEAFDRSMPAEAEGILREAEDEQNLRQVVTDLPPRCQKLIRMLFFEEPARPYQEVAQSLGIATGSIGFIRQRCLERLRKRLLEVGFA
jgi:RNA polymerase sigma factor (sigma-70 family)